MPSASTRVSLRKLAAVALLYFFLALIYTYPLVRSPAEANRFNSPDALLTAWILSWDLHQLGNGSLDLFDANIFFPEANSLAYSENLVTAAVLVLPLWFATDDPILLVNAALLLALVANGIAGFLLGLQFSRSSSGAVLTGLLLGFGSFHWAHIPHLQLQLFFPLAMAFYFARRMRDEPGWRPASGLALAVTATFGASGYYALFLATALPFFVVADLFGVDRGERKRVVAGFALSAPLVVALSLPLLLPYGSKMSSGYRRALSAAEENSAHPSAYVTSAARLHFFLPSEEQEPFFPGFAGVGLLGFAIFRAVTKGSRRQDVLVWCLVGLVGIAISLGPDFGLFSLLYQLGPYQGLRVPSRAGVLFLLAASVLAGIGLSYIRRRGLRLLLVVLAAAECYAGPLPWIMDVPELPPIYETVANLEEPGALVELPLPPPESFQDNAGYVYRSIFHWRPLVNGYSGFVPHSYREAHRLLMSDALEVGLEKMASVGVRFLLAHTARLGPRMRRRIDAAEERKQLELVEEKGPDRLYRILPR